MDQFPPSILVYHYGHFEFFRKFAEIFAAQATSKWKKSSSRKILIILFGHPWVVELTYIQISAFKFTLRCLQPDNVPIICQRCQWHRWQICHRCCWYQWRFGTGVVDTGGKFSPVSLTPVANLPPVSTIQGELVANLTPVSMIPAAICHRWQICHRCRWHRWCTLTCEYLREF